MIKLENNIFYKKGIVFSPKLLLKKTADIGSIAEALSEKPNISRVCNHQPACLSNKNIRENFKKKMDL